MKSLFIFMLVCLCGFRQSEETKIEVVDLEGYTEILEKAEKPLVVNFWATWCKPCIEEIPDLVDLDQNNDGFDVIFISMDQEIQLNKAGSILSERGGFGNHYLLTARDENLTTIFPGWYGAVPMTLIYQSGKMIGTYDRRLTQQDLSSITNKF